VSTALLASTTACSSNSSTGNEAKETQAPIVEPVTTPSTTPVALPDLNASNVVAGLSGAGYKCGNDGTYAICTAGPVAVWVLTGTHKRPPVVSLHSAGPAQTATAAIAKDLPRVLQVAHISQSSQITSWFGQQAGKPAAQTTAGDWQVDWSVEVDSEEPGAHLSLMDKLCKANCQAE